MDYGISNRHGDNNQENDDDEYNTNHDNEIQDIDEEQLGELEIDNPQEENEQDQHSIYENDEAYLLNDENQDKGDDQERAEDEGINSKGYYQTGPYSNQDPQSNQYVYSNKYKIKAPENESNYSNAPQQINEDADQENAGPDNQNEDKSNVGSLMKLQYISVCQACKENFNSSVNIPYLLKCGHFFCRNCIVYGLTDEEGRINCPDDGVVANNISELKLLSNLIFDDQQENVDEKLNNNCTKHPDQRLNHFIENTMEVVCVNCAFARFKSDPRLDIKEISEKCAEINEDLNKILEENQKNVETLRNTLESIKENKTSEENKVNSFYDGLIKLLDQKREDHIDQISNIFNSNADKLSERLDVFSQKMEESEEFKQIINQIAVSPDSGVQIADVINHFNQFIKENDGSNSTDLALTEFKFANENEGKVTKYLSSLGELKQKSKLVKFDSVNVNQPEISKQATPQRTQIQGNDKSRKDNQSTVSSVKKNYDNDNNKNDIFTAAIVEPEIKYKTKENKHPQSSSLTYNHPNVGITSSHMNKVGNSVSQASGANAINNSFMKPASATNNQNNYLIPNYTAPKINPNEVLRANKDKEKDQSLLSGYTIDKQKNKYSSNVVNTEDLLKENREIRNKGGLNSKYGIGHENVNSSYNLDADKRGPQLGSNQYSDYGFSGILNSRGNNEISSYPYNIYSTATNASKQNSLLDENRYNPKSIGGQQHYQPQPTISLANQNFENKYKPARVANTYDIESGKYLLGKR